MSSFVRRTSKVPAGLNFDDKLVKNYSLSDKVVEVGKHQVNGKEEKDYLIRKVPIVVDSYHVDKLVQANSKGADLKSILKRVQTTGDISLLNKRNPIYGDISNIPQSTGEAFQKSLDDSRKLNSLKKEEVDILASCQGKTPEEIMKICSEYYSNKLKKNPVPEPDDSNEKGEE